MIESLENLDEIVSINAKVRRGFRTKAVIASRMLGTDASKIMVEALERAIAKAEQKHGEIAL